MRKVLENKIENRFKTLFEAHGFKVLKFTCPGTIGVPDRFVMRPIWSPGPPMVCEIKKPDEKPRAVQVAMMLQMSARGVKVLKWCNSYEDVEDRLKEELAICEAERIYPPAEIEKHD